MVVKKKNEELIVDTFGIAVLGPLGNSECQLGLTANASLLPNRKKSLRIENKCCNLQSKPTELLGWLW